MEFFIELVLEIVLEGVLEGAIAGVDSKKVPFWLRILLAVVLLLGFAGLAVFLIWVAVNSDSLPLQLLMIVVLAVLLFVVGWKTVKVFRKWKRWQQEERLQEKGGVYEKDTDCRG